jgi:hypothetical protein
VSAIAKVGVVLAAVTLFAGNVSASVDKEGYYDIFQNGVRIGSERYSWETGDEGTNVLAGECVIEVNGISTTFRPSLTLQGEGLTPVSLAIESSQGDDLQEIMATFEGARADYVLKENGMESKKNIKIKPAELVVDENILHLFVVLAERYDFDKAGEQDMSVFDVVAKKSYTAHCRIRGIGTVENASGKYRARRLTIDLESLQVDLLVDRDGRVPQISIPMKKMEAKLKGYNSGDKAELTPGR